MDHGQDSGSKGLRKHLLRENSSREFETSALSALSRIRQEIINENPALGTPPALDAMQVGCASHGGGPEGYLQGIATAGGCHRCGQAAARVRHANPRSPFPRTHSRCAGKKASVSHGTKETLSGATSFTVGPGFGACYRLAPTAAAQPLRQTRHSASLCRKGVSRTPDAERGRNRLFQVSALR